MYTYNNTSRFIWADWQIQGQGAHKGATMIGAEGKNLQNLSPDALKMHFLTLPVLTFFSERFPKLLKFTLQNILLLSLKIISALASCRGLCKRKPVLLPGQNFLNNNYVLNKKTNVKNKKDLLF